MGDKKIDLNKLADELKKAGWEVKGTEAIKFLGDSTYLKIDFASLPISKIYYRVGGADQIPWNLYIRDKWLTHPRVEKELIDLNYIVNRLLTQSGSEPSVTKDNELIKVTTKPEARPGPEQIVAQGAGKKLKPNREFSFGAWVDRGEPKEKIMKQFALSEQEYERKLANLQKLRDGIEI